MRALTRVLPALAAALCCSALMAGVLLEPREAPEWEIQEWIKGNPGKLSSHREKIVLINFFQMWCPGSTSFSLPLFQRWHDTYGDRDDFLIVSIHTVFEEHGRQSPDHLRAFIRENRINHTVGIDAYTPGEQVPVTMGRFDNKGSPQVVIIDKQGQLRFSHFGIFDPKPVEYFIDRLLTEAETDDADKSKDESAGSSSKSGSKSRSKGKKRRKTPPKSRPDESESEEADQPEPDSEERASSRTGRRGASGPGGAGPSETDEPAEDEPPAEPKVPGLSGTYRVRLKQTAKSCGQMISPTEYFINLDVFEDRIDVKAARPFLGFVKLTADYDERTKTFHADVRQPGKERSFELMLDLQLTGQFTENPQRPELEFSFSFDKSGDPGWECQIEGEGSGRKMGGANDSTE